ncbi:MAG: hypothetical protein HW380_3018 [Magnetococcales bacterium]|nr:hypothetical protein [Magnetococcales bacterium]
MMPFGQKTRTLGASPPNSHRHEAFCLNSKPKPWGTAPNPAGGDDPPRTPAIIFANFVFPIREYHALRAKIKVKSGEESFLSKLSKKEPWGTALNPAGGDDPPRTPAIIFANFVFPIRK